MASQKRNERADAAVQCAIPSEHFGAWGGEWGGSSRAAGNERSEFACGPAAVCPVKKRGKVRRPCGAEEAARTGYVVVIS